jgi:DNA-binding transcriptional ArsR family regulator
MARLDTAAVAALFADRSRVAMLDVLLDGRDHTVGELAHAAAIRPSTAVGHLARLEEAQLVSSERRGRERLVRLAGPQVATAFESLAELAGQDEAHGLRTWTRREQLRLARTCYDHLAGRLGVGLASAAVAAGALDEQFGLGPSAHDWFGRLGVDPATVAHRSRPLIRVCTDWTERRPHVAGALGAAICSRLVEDGWVVRHASGRALRVTPRGESALRGLGISLEN